MKLFKMMLDMPYRYSEGSEELLAADVVEARRALGQAGLCFDLSVSQTELAFVATGDQAAKQIESTADLGAGFHGDLYNEHANAHMTGNTLSSYNELILCENSCTDNIQEYLSEGWRIVAVCPQASRRPDYILGRYNTTFGAPKSALRG